MIRFKTILQSAQDRDRILHGRLLYHDTLEPSFQSRILFDIFSILVKRRCTDAAQLTAGKHRFKQIGRIHASFCLAGTDQIMDLVDEQDNAALCILHFFQNRFQTFFEFTPVFRTGNQRSHIQFDQFFVFQRLRYIALHDTPSNTFYYGCLTNTRLTDQYRVVFCLT